LVAYDIHKVIYAPHKVFKEIIQNPKYHGPVIIMILFILVSVAGEYARGSRIFIQQTLPTSLNFENPDPWTESTGMWTSNARMTNNTQDYLLHGSVQFQVANDTRISMALNNIGPIDCLRTGGYRNLTFSAKWIHPTAAAPQSVVLYLNAPNVTRYFYRSLTVPVTELGNNTWGNFTLPLGSNATEWLNTTSQESWSNVGSLRIEFEWTEPDKSNLTVLIDKLFFLSESFDPLNSFAGNSVGQFAMYTGLDYGLNLVLFSIALFVGVKIFHVQTTFKILIVIVGYAMVGMVILKALFSIYYLVMPSIYVYFDLVKPAYAFANLLLFTFYTTLLLPVWPIIITSVAGHVGFDRPLSRSIVMGVIAFLPYYIMRFLVGT